MDFILSAVHHGGYIDLSFDKDIMDRVDIIKLAYKYGWKIEKAKDKSLLIFNRIVNGQHQQLNIWFTRMTIATSLNHPKRGKTQLFGKNIGAALLEKIMNNPRHHTGKRYYEKKKIS